MKKLMSIMICCAVLFVSASIHTFAAEPSGSVDLLNEADARVIETLAFPKLQNGYPYTYAHDGKWDSPEQQCWLTSADYSNQNYLQITFDQPYQLEKIVFSLRAGSGNAWLRKGTLIQASETEDFTDASVLYDSENTDPGVDVIEAVVSEALAEKKFQYIRFCKPNGNLNPVGLTELQVFGIPSVSAGHSPAVVDLLHEQLEENGAIAYPGLFSAQFQYKLCRDGEWGTYANNCWLSSGWNGTPYLQVNLKKAFSIQEVKFSLRVDVSASESSAYVRKNTVLWASNDPEFKTYDVLWDAGTEDPGEEIITASAQEKPYQYFRWTKSKGTDPVGLTELRIFGYQDSITYYLDDKETEIIENGNLKMDIRYFNSQESSGSCQCIIAVYRGNDLQKLQVYPVEWTASDPIISVADQLDMGQVETGDVVKVMFWNSWTDMQPIQEIGWIE